MIRNLALLLVSTLLSLLALEVMVRLAWLPMPAFVASDAWWQERWHRKRRGMNPREFVHLDPDLGYIPAAGLRNHEYQGVRISTNAAHQRGTREIPLARTGKARVVAIGDSFTFGQCADDDGAFPAILETILPDSEVLNLGVMGYGQDQALLRLRRDGFPYAPDAVVFGFHHSDMRRNLLRFRGYGKPRFVMTDAGLVVDNVPVPPPESYDRLWPPRLWNFVQIYRDSKRPKQEIGQHIEALSRAILFQMAADTKARGIPLFVVHLPHPHSLGKRGDHGWPFMEQLCGEAAEHDFRCVNPVPRFREIASTPELVSRHFDCHFSPELYRAVAEVTAEALVRDLPTIWPEPAR